MNAIIIDDNNLALKGLRQLIPWEELGIHLIGEAMNGQEGFTKVINLQPDIVITDIRMPVMTGLELCKEIYNCPIDPEIIILSAYEDFSYAKKALKYGVKDYILKPINRTKVNELIDILKNLKANHEKNTAFINSILTEDIEASIYKALSSQDKDFMDHFFSEHIFKLYTTKNEANQLVLRMINTVYNYFNDIGMNIDSIISSKISTLNTLLAIKDTTVMFDRLKKIFDQLFQFSHYNIDHEDMIGHAIQIIEESYGDSDLSVGKIAEQLYITPTYLSILFKKQKNTNLYGYITKCRLNKAISMLKNPAYKVSYIAKKVGYKDARYFSKVFKKHTGYTPSHYRDKIIDLNMKK